METFSISNSLSGGILIGAAASLLLIFNGKIAGISGILAGLLSPKSGDTLWRTVFVLGLIFGGIMTPILFNRVFIFTLDVSLPVILIGGFLVGFGTRLGSGCTSGHGVCGIGRFSIRSIVATITFILSAMITVFVTRHMIGL